MCVIVCIREGSPEDALICVFMLRRLIFNSVLFNIGVHWLCQCGRRVDSLEYFCVMLKRIVILLSYHLP